MCFNDWRVGRLIRTINFPFFFGNPATLILPPSQTRVGLMVSCIAPNSLGGAVSGIKETASGNFLCWIPVNAQATLLTIATHGDLPTRGLTITSTGDATIAMAVCAFEATEDMLAVGLDQFNTKYSRRL